LKIGNVNSLARENLWHSLRKSIYKFNFAFHLFIILGLLSFTLLGRHHQVKCSLKLLNLLAVHFWNLFSLRNTLPIDFLVAIAFIDIRRRAQNL
jgi:hypothetical protein